MKSSFHRHRRLRTTAGMRQLVRETELRATDFIYPIFVTEGENIKSEVESMPGVYQLSLDRLREEVEEVASLGIQSVIVFGVPEHKDAVGSEAYHDHGIVQKAISKIKEDFPELVVVADTCLCEYTDHGHCGLVENGEILN
ncbi:porphobilinogen synthase, partial [Klebsiella pneumoniae]|nr:porphobilinogen synthase [Klebsiella pneumoniae]